MGFSGYKVYNRLWGYHGLSKDRIRRVFTGRIWFIGFGVEGWLGVCSLALGGKVFRSLLNI